jgi:two-component system, NtrC family, response regulator AtoC
MMMITRPRVLVVEDDEDMALGLQALLTTRGKFTTQHAATAAAARDALHRQGFDAVLADLTLPDGDGLSLIEEIASRHPGLGLLCLTGRDEASSAVRALRAGALEYLTKPTSGDQLIQALQGAVTRAAMRQPAAPSDLDPVGEAPSWLKAMNLLERVARSPRTTLLLTGEPGVGKEEAAARLHRLSARHRGPYVAVNAACLPASLIESELFGHEMGSFTGAMRQRRGLLEQADGGTLFLDEIGEMPIELQARLLRVMEGQPFRRVGGERLVSVDVRVVCATNRRLDERVQQGAFRADLYERLRVFEIALPPLRERPGDAVLLAHHFLARLSRDMGREPVGFSPEALDTLERHPFPGNVRELRNLIERALVLTEGVIERRHLSSDLMTQVTMPPAPPARSSDQLEDVIRAHILRVYEQTQHNVTRTAQLLDMSRLAVRRRLQSYGVRPRQGEDSR